MKVLAEETITVSCQDGVRFLEKATKRAMKDANYKFGTCEDTPYPEPEGYMSNSCSVEIKLDEFIVSSGMGGWTYTAIFNAQCLLHEDDD